MTQLRRSVPAPLQTLFDSGVQLVTADLYTITLSGGTVLRLTGYDQVVSLSGTSWLLGPGIESNKLKVTAGIEVDTMILSLSGGPSTTLNGVAMMPFINGGGLDGATVLAERAYAASPGNTWVGKLQRFYGKVSDIDRPSRAQADVTVRSFFELLNVNLPRNVYQAGCLNSVYDSACGIDKSSFTVAGSVTSGTSGLRLSIGASGLSGYSDGYFSLGAIRFASGQNNGVLRTIRVHAAGGSLTFMQPLPLPAAVGDTFQIYPGCAQTQSACTTKFGNIQRFRGQPFIPVAETVL